MAYARLEELIARYPLRGVKGREAQTARWVRVTVCRWDNPATVE
ncbi:hypothetical protein [Acrocarpospora sp. B8E8]